MADKELSFQEIASHNSKKDLYLVVHDKVYDCSSFVDEHPYVLPPFSPREKGKKKDDGYGYGYGYWKWEFINDGC